MADPGPKSETVTLQKTWFGLMTTMGRTNMQRVKDARRAANALQAMRRKR